MKKVLSDFKANHFNPHSCFVVLFYRIAHYASISRKRNILNNLWAIPILMFYRIISEFVLGIEIQAGARIGTPLIVHHGYGIVINKNAVLGNNCSLRHGVTVGNNGKDNFCPRIGNNVVFGANVVMYGSIEIGDNVTIGPNSVVFTNIAENSLVLPAKSTIKEKCNENTSS